MRFCQEFQEIMTEDMAGRLEQLRARQPLVHLLTNYVTVNDCVNALLAVGARAICSHAPEEAAQVTAGADVLVCNLGGTEYYNAMLSSARTAGERRLPLVIDPVGCAASSHRREMCFRLIRIVQEARKAARVEYTQTDAVTAVRGNYAEIRALLDHQSKGAGLDSVRELSRREEEALGQRMMSFACEHRVLLIASGETDLCTDGNRLLELHRGTPALRRITGAGCLSTGLVGAFLVQESSLESAAAAVTLVGLAGEAAAAACRDNGTGAGHFHMYLMDALSAADPVWRE